MIAPVSVRDFPAAQRPYRPYGRLLDVFYDRHREVLVEGPAGTGKTISILNKIHLCAEKYDGMRVLIARKTRASMTQSVMATFEAKVVPPGRLASFGKVLRSNRSSYAYPNGSEIVLAGLDEPDRLMSTDYDIVYIPEATEADLGEWEQVLTRLRNYVMPYQQLIADCNPGPPAHWLNQRAHAGTTERFVTRHEDNPLLYDHEREQWTEQGIEYVFGTLEALTGARKERFRYGRWAQAEGVVYPEYDSAIHLLPRTEIEPLAANWPRYWVVDWGYTNPFVWQEWAADPDSRLYLMREIYMTGRTVREHCATLREIVADLPRPTAVIVDHDAEDRATFEEEMRVETEPAYKAVSIGIQAVKTRLVPAGDGYARLFFLRDTLYEPDPALVAAARPFATVQEFDGYIWNAKNGRIVGEEPLKRDDHGMDAMRYMVAHLDLDQDTSPLVAPLTIDAPSLWRF